MAFRLVGALNTNMLKKIVPIGIILAFGLYLALPTKSSDEILEPCQCQQPTAEKPVSDEIQLSHRQTVWLYALEWCESRGNGVKSINPRDRDGTPSYYHYQFKVSTFRGFAKKYGFPASLLDQTTIAKIPQMSNQELLKLMENRALTEHLVKKMILDPKTSWELQFPVCVKNLGRPPLN